MRMRPAEIQVKINIAQREADWWRNLLKNKGCADCIHYQGNACDLTDGLTPPPDVLKTGCPEWNWDEIPF